MTEELQELDAPETQPEMPLEAPEAQPEMPLEASEMQPEAPTEEAMESFVTSFLEGYSGNEDIIAFLQDWRENLTATVEPVPRPFLTTPFEEYSVTEGFYLVFLLCAFLAAMYHFIRRFV